MARTAVIYSRHYLADLHGHVFPIQKYALVMERLLRAGLVAAEEVIAPAPATREELLLVHTPAYLNDFFGLVMTHRTCRSEMALDQGIVAAFVRGTGGTIRAAREALARGAAVNIGGGLHHAYPDHAEGFCYLNDVAVALRCVQRDGAVRTALVVDCDLHQGNGTAAIFARDPAVTTFSIHQENNYPLKERSDLDVGLPDRADDALYLGELGLALEALFARGRYDLVLYLAGADPYQDDQLGGLSLTMDGLRRRDRLVLEGCRDRGIPVAVVLAGGYAHRLEDTVSIHVQTVEELLRLDPARAADPGGGEADLRPAP